MQAEEPGGGGGGGRAGGGTSVSSIYTGLVVLTMTTAVVAHIEGKIYKKENAEALPIRLLALFVSVKPGPLPSFGVVRAIVGLQ